MTLEPIRLFDQTGLNTFKHIESDAMNTDHDQPTTSSQYRKIRPAIYKTFLKTKDNDSNTKVCAIEIIIADEADWFKSI